MRVFDVPRFSPKTSAEYLEKPTLNQISTSRIDLGGIQSTRHIPRGSPRASKLEESHSPSPPLPKRIAPAAKSMPISDDEAGEPAKQEESVEKQ